MIGDGQTMHLANYNKPALTIDTPYGVVTRRVKVTVDETGVEISIIDPFVALWMITCPALGFLETIISDARPVWSMHVGKELTDGLERYVFRAELDALVQYVQPWCGDV